MTRQALIELFAELHKYREAIPLLEEQIEIFGPNAMLMNNLVRPYPNLSPPM